MEKNVTVHNFDTKLARLRKSRSFYLMHELHSKVNEGQENQIRFDVRSIILNYSNY